MGFEESGQETKRFIIKLVSTVQVVLPNSPGPLKEPPVFTVSLLIFF